MENFIFIRIYDINNLYGYDAAVEKYKLYFENGFYYKYKDKVDELLRDAKLQDVIVLD